MLLDDVIPKLFQALRSAFPGLPDQTHHLAKNAYGAFAAGLSGFDHIADLQLEFVFVYDAVKHERGLTCLDFLYHP